MTAMITTVDNVLSRELAAATVVGSDVVFRDRAAHLKRSLLPALDWLGARKEFPLNIDTIRSAFEWEWLSSLTQRRIVLLQDRGSGEWRAFCSAWDMPTPLLDPLEQYVRTVVVRNDLRTGSDEDERQHGLVTMYFAAGFTRLRCDIAHWVH